MHGEGQWLARVEPVQGFEWSDAKGWVCGCDVCKLDRHEELIPGLIEGV